MRIEPLDGVWFLGVCLGVRCNQLHLSGSRGVIRGGMQIIDFLGGNESNPLQILKL